MKKEINIKTWGKAKALSEMITEFRNTPHLESMPKMCSNADCGATDIPYNYHEPKMIVMTEAAFHVMIRDYNADQYGLNMSDWTFQGLPLATIKQTMNPNPDWIMIL